MASSETEPSDERRQTTVDRSRGDALGTERRSPVGDAVRPTTILLSREDEAWRATQRGVDVVGRGPSAPLAAARYCRRVAATVDGDEPDEESDGDVRNADGSADGSESDGPDGDEPDGAASTDEKCTDGNCAASTDGGAAGASADAASENGTSERGASRASAARIDGAVGGPACRCSDPAPEP